MKRLPSIAVTFLLLAIPAQLLAKGEIVKITIKGAELKAPIEITDPKAVTEFQVWSGPGTSSSDPGYNPNVPGFVVDWTQPVADPPKGFHNYEVSFYAKMPDERLVYVVFYEYDPATERGYIYLPGRHDESYWLNMGSIARGVEGRWFRAWSVWEAVARPLIAGAKGKA